MVRTSDPFWAYVEDLNDGRKKCKFCEYIYARGTPITRVKGHLSGFRRYGARSCEMVPEDVKEAARAAIDGPPEKKLKTSASSSNTEAGDTRIPASLPGQNSEAENGMTDRSAELERFQMHTGEIGLHGGGTSRGDRMVDATETAHIIEEVGQEEMQMHSQLPTTLQPTDPECRRMIDGDGSREGLQNTTGDEARGQPNNEVENGMTGCVPGALERWHIGKIVLPDEGISPGDLLGNTGQNSEAENGMTYLSPVTPVEWLQTLVDEPGPDDEGTCPEVLMVDPAETAHIIEEGGQEEMQMHSQSPTTLQLTDPGCPWTADDIFMNDDENMNTEPERTIVRNRGMIEQQVEGTIRGDLMVNAAEATLRTAQVSQDCEPTPGIPYWSTESTEDIYVRKNMELTSVLIHQLEGSVLLEGFTVDEDGQPTDLQQVNERHGNQICSPSLSNDMLRNDGGNMTREPKQTVVGDGSSESLQHTTADQARGDVFPTSKVLGGAFKENKEVICSWLMNNEVSLIGIYGMGGVGKTTLVKHIHNQLHNMQNRYRDVYWITVSQDFSIYKLQKLIAEHIGLDLSNANDEMHRAAKLSKALAGRQNYVLILDDLWNDFEPEEVGIPSKMDGCKLILTTRSKTVCRQMRCEDNMIEVKPLLKEEAWNLFRMELGSYDIKLEHLAKSVADECDGLPLGIRTMARSMRGVHDEREWRNALEELQESRVRRRDMEHQVFKILKFSYHHLNDTALQECFLYCALFREDYEIKKEELIELFISEGMIKGRKSRAAAFDKGHEILNRLVNASLLESEDIRFVKMHDLVRDMAVQEMREKSDVIVEAGEQLEELPDEEKWTQNIVRVSLMSNCIREIPSCHSPRCPNLSTLLLSQNMGLEFIGDSFFKQMRGLKLLDLSDTTIKELPDSISDLVTLTALLLRNCYGLTHVPPLGKLKALKKLDLHATALGKVPRGLGLLSSLEYLDLNSIRIRIPAGILPKHRHLQVLRLGLNSFPIMEKAEELGCLRKLETLECRFDDLIAFKMYLKELDHDKKQTQLPSKFNCLIRHVNSSNHLPSVLKDVDRVINLYGQEINRSCGDAWLLPKGIEGLEMQSCSDMKSLCDFYPSQHKTQYEIELKYLSISNCDSMECLVSSSQMSKSMLGTIEDLQLWGLDELRFLFSKEGAAPTPLLPGDGIFSHLKTLAISECPKLETLFPPGVLLNLQNLERIEVRRCYELKKIISEEESNITSNDLANEFSLPKLHTVKLQCLFALMSNGCGKLICNSLRTLQIEFCQRLKELPFSCSPRTLENITVVPKVWWESVEWDWKNDYTVQYETKPMDERYTILALSRNRNFEQY